MAINRRTGRRHSIERPEHPLTPAVRGFHRFLILKGPKNFLKKIFDFLKKMPAIGYTADVIYFRWCALREGWLHYRPGPAHTGMANDIE